MCTVAAPKAEARFWQCVPYARMISGVNLYGNALTWWKQAVGKYTRGAAPKVGAVMSFAATTRMRLGHVATVAKVVSAREVILNHANWSRRGGVEKGVRAVDVSAAGDWSRVKVWFASVGGLGTSSYPVNGFIYADGKGDDSSRTAATTPASAAVQAGAVAPVSMAGTTPVDTAKRAATFALDLQ